MSRHDRDPEQNIASDWPTAIKAYNMVLKVFLTGDILQEKLRASTKSNCVVDCRWAMLGVLAWAMMDWPVRLSDLLSSLSKQNPQRGTLGNANDKPETLNGGQKKDVPAAVRHKLHVSVSV